jgi:hypothetical protein
VSCKNAPRVHLYSDGHHVVQVVTFRDWEFSSPDRGDDYYPRGYIDDILFAYPRDIGLGHEGCDTRTNNVVVSET